MTQKFASGTSVSINFAAVGYGSFGTRTGTIRGALRGIPDTLFVEIEGEFEGHNGNGLLDGGDIKVGSRGWYVRDHALTAIDRVPGFQFNSIHPPKVGDVVKLGRVEIGTVARVSGDMLSFTDRVPNWALYSSTAASRCTLMIPAGAAPAPAPKATPVKPSAPKKPEEPTAPMAIAVLTMLRKKGDVTSIEAQGVLRCRSLSKRISELKQLGHKITRSFHKDHTGQRYARYALTA